MARPPTTLSISDADRSTLESWLRRPTHAQGETTRARIVLLSTQGLKATEIAAALGVNMQTVYTWRRRFVAEGIEGLQDRPRPGQPRKLDPAKAEEILRLTVERIPREATHWSVRLMADYAGVTTWQVREVWKGADLKPHRLKTFKISKDPLFAEKVRDVVGLYMDPPVNAAVLSVDEKTQIQALDRTQPMLPLRPGQVERRTHDYKRNGTLSLYAAFDVLTGEVLGRTTKRHRAKEFLAFLRQIDRSVDAHLDVHLILDNSSTHSTPAIQKWLADHPRFVLHFTPTSASWLNAVEGWFSQLQRRAIERGIFTSVQDLREAIQHFIRSHNARNAKPFVWTKSAESILGAVERAKLAS